VPDPGAGARVPAAVTPGGIPEIAAATSFDALVAAWMALQPRLGPEQKDGAWNEFVEAFARLAAEAPAELDAVLEQRLREGIADQRVRGAALERLRAAAPERAAAYVRDALLRTDPVARRFATENLDLLPEAEAVAAWERMLRDQDPDVRGAAVEFLPGEDPVHAEILDRAADAETDLRRRGEMLAMAFDAQPLPGRLERLLQEFERHSDPQFRQTLLAGLSDRLTPQDTGAIAILQRVAADRGEHRDVREWAFTALFQDEPRLLAPQERDRLQEARARMLRDQER
jgi:hypothetical protein